MHHRLATHWARLIELLYAAERMLELARDPEITSPHVRTIPNRVEGEGVAGFTARSMPGSGKYPEPGMLYGAAGIGAVFAAAVSDVEPSWDAMFALSDAGMA